MLITNFSAGELSPNLYGRVDLQQYYSGAAKLKNFEIIPTGGIKRRTGTKRVKELASDCKLIPFIIDKNESYILIVRPGAQGSSAGIIEAYRNGTTTTVTSSFPLNSITEIKQLQYAQNYDTIILTHKEMQPYEIIKTGSGWTAASMTFDFTPICNVDDDYDQVMVVYGNEKPVKTAGANKYTYKKYDKTKTEKYTTVTKEYDKDATAYCVVNGNFFKHGSSDSDTWKENSEDPSIDTSEFTAAGKYPSTVTFFNNRLFFAATKNCPQKVWASCTPDTEGNRYKKFSTYQKFVTISRGIKDPDAHVFTCDLLVEKDEEGEVTNGNVNVLKNVTQDFTKSGILKKGITSYYVSGNNIPVGTKVVSVTSDTITIDNDIELEDDVKAVTCTIQLWKDYDMSDAEDYEYTVVETNAVTSDCSFNFELASRENDAIKWLAANRYLTIGTESTVWCCPNAITALQIVVENAGHYGSDEQQAICVDQAVVFFSQGGYGIREQYYNAQTEGFTTNNIALHAEHLLRESPAVDFDYLNNPYNRLIIIRENGSAVHLLYDKNNGILAWNQIEHGLKSNTFKNCAVVRGARQNDIIFYTVKDGSKYYLESYDDNDGVYLDSWQSYNPSLDTGSNNPYAGYGNTAKLFNKTTEKLCDYASIPDDFLHDNDDVYIGYLYESIINSLPVINSDPTSKKRIVNLTVRFMESYLPVMKVADLPEETFSHVKTVPYSGQQLITYPGASNKDVSFELHADIPHEVNILSVNALVV